MAPLALGNNLAHGPLQALTPLQGRYLKQEAPPHQLCSEIFRQLPGRPGRTSGGEHVIGDEDPVSGTQRVTMGFQGITAVLQVV
jgi:hypothetical protein